LFDMLLAKYGMQGSVREKSVSVNKSLFRNMRTTISPVPMVSFLRITS